MERKGFYMLDDGYERYTLPELSAILKQAEDMGFPLEQGSYVEAMSIKQLAMLVRGEYDA